MGLRTEKQREEGKVFPIKGTKTGGHVGSSKGPQSGTVTLGEAGDAGTGKESVGSCPGRGPGLNDKRGFIQTVGDMNPKPVR